MARAKVVHSEDGVCIIFKGNKKNPEPGTAVIKFPGGHVEVSRCSDQESYWIHVSVDESENMDIADSRIDYDHEEWRRRCDKGQRPIPEIEGAEHIKKIAIKVTPRVIAVTGE